MIHVNINFDAPDEHFNYFKSLQQCSGQNRWKSPPKNVKVVKEPSDEYQTDCHEIEPNLSKDRAMPAGDYPSL